MARPNTNAGRVSRFIKAELSAVQQLQAADLPMYPSQFLLGPDYAERLESWQRVQVAGDFRLTAHPDLACTQILDGGKELTLIGHLLDPHSPAATNETILWQLLYRFSSREALVEATSGYGGRWLIIAADGKQRFLFHDPLGSRQAFYTDPREIGALWVMSQPGIGAEVLMLTPDEEASAYLDSYAFRRKVEYAWPGNSTPFKGLSRLLPNHWLDLDTGACRRYWPSQAIPAITPEAAIERLATLFPGIVRAAATRFELALSLTAGLDSRLVLAASRSVKDEVTVVTVRQARLPDDHADLTIAARLAEQLGMAHEVIRAPTTTSADFSRIFKRSVYSAHDHYAPDVEAILRQFSRTKTALTGSGAEIARGILRASMPWAEGKGVSAADIARRARVEGQAFPLRHYQAWLEDAHERRNVKLLDLLQWELAEGSWLPWVQLEFDMAWYEIITPYNCRDVLVTLLGVDERYRSEPDYVVVRGLIERLWPEVLLEPINPHKRATFVQRVKRHTRMLLTKYGLWREGGG